MTESWTDQRVNQLKKLWQQGKSASEIAETLGGVTRNAVIGKAHRLGLSGRPSPIKKPAPAKKGAVPVKAPAKTAAKPAPAAKPAAKAPVKAAPTPLKAAPAKPLAPAAGKPVLAPANQSAPAKAPAGKGTPFNPPMAAEMMARPLMVHDGKVISILELTERTCRWPIGDPKDPAFGYCGATAYTNFPYCAGHVAMAFQSSRKDNRKVMSDVKVEDIPDIEVEDIEDVEAEEGLEDDTLDDEADDELSLEV